MAIRTAFYYTTHYGIIPNAAKSALEEYDDDAMCIYRETGDIECKRFAESCKREIADREFRYAK